MQRIWEEYKDKGVVVIGIALWAEGDPFQRAKEFVEKHKLNYFVLVDPDEDSEVAKAYGVMGVPTNFIIGRNGKIRWMKTGFSREAEKEMKRVIEEALK